MCNLMTNEKLKNEFGKGIDSDWREESCDKEGSFETKYRGHDPIRKRPMRH